MKFDLLVENILNDNKETIKLYRGDSKEHNTHSLSKGDTSALFGQGIYLSSNPRIANDYKAKGNNDIIFRGNGFKTKEKVIDRYIWNLARNIDENGKKSFYEIPMPPYSDDPERLKRLEFAKQKWDKIKDQYIVRINVDGTSTISKKESGHLSIYEIPQNIINKTYDVEPEIEKNAIDALSSTLLKTYGNSNVLKEILKKDEDGFLPSFRQIWLTLRHEYDLLNDEKSQIQFRKSMKAIGGYTGLEYAGGVTMGGGILHRAFVLWDEQGIKKYKIK